MLDSLKIALQAGWAEYRRRTAPSYTFYTGIEIGLAVVAVAGALVSAYAAYEGAQSQKQALKDQRRIHEEDARAAQVAGQAAAARQRAKDRARLESFATAAGSAGVVAREGTPLLNELDFTTQSELEAMHVQHGYTLQSRQKGVAADLAGRKAAEINPAASAGVSLLSSAGSIAGSYYTGRGAGAQTGGGLTARASAPAPGYASAPPSSYQSA